MNILALDSETDFFSEKINALKGKNKSKIEKFENFMKNIQTNINKEEINEKIENVKNSIDIYLPTVLDTFINLECLIMTETATDTKGREEMPAKIEIDEEEVKQLAEIMEISEASVVKAILQLNLSNLDKTNLDQTNLVLPKMIVVDAESGIKEKAENTMKMGLKNIEAKIINLIEDKNVEIAQKTEQDLPNIETRQDQLLINQDETKYAKPYEVLQYVRENVKNIQKQGEEIVLPVSKKITETEELLLPHMLEKNDLNTEKPVNIENTVEVVTLPNELEINLLQNENHQNENNENENHENDQDSNGFEDMDNALKLSVSAQKDLVLKDFSKSIENAIPASKTAIAANVDTTDVVNQIIENMNVQTIGNNHEVKVKLYPEQLGDISLKISSENGVINAQFTAENQKVKEIIESNFNLLRENFKEQGLEISGLSVSVKQGNEGNSEKFPSKRQIIIDKINNKRYEWQEIEETMQVESDFISSNVDIKA